MDALKIYGSSSSQGQKLKDMMEDVRVRTMVNVKFNIQHIVLRVLFMQLGMSFTVSVFAYFFTQGQISSSILIAILFLIGELFTPVGKLAVFYHMAFDGVITSNSIAEFLNENLIVKDEGTKELTEAPQKIKFKNISFAYEDKEALFNNLNLAINRGEHIALVGESGSGKTTIFNLLLRFFDVKDGEILFDNCNIKEYKLKELRKLIAYVSQDTYLFHGTIKENLLLANPKATEEELISATKSANIHSFIESLPEGYDSFVGERGVNFSGGQRQRISIARALLKNAPVILLDEATASVDSENEEAIKNALDILLENKTSITIAHRLNTIEYADKIIVLSKGKIVEEGTHTELMTNKAAYYNLLKAQNITKIGEN
ncbi:MAG: hypothetical protein CR988_02435 [Treponema sp.]|nr:MAG: hypothetical protein CR988_02435 [Treponema sp.]